MNKLTIEEFEDIVDNTLDEIQDTLIVKAKEYIRNEDPLHNFRMGSNMTGGSKEKVMWGFMVKHLVSLQDLINEESKDLELIEEKIGDLLCYLVLMQASFEETILDYETE